MVTRLYFPLTEAGPVTPPAPSGTDWEHIEPALPVRKLLTTADSSTLTTHYYDPDAGVDDATDKDMCFRQYVSDSLDAQTLSGTVSAQFQCSEDHASDNLFLTLKILVCNSTGSSTVATLLAITRDDTEVRVSAGGSVNDNRTWSGGTLSSYACSAGDRLVVEVGLGGLPVKGAGVNNHAGAVRFGCSASSGDLPVDDTTSATTYRPWLEFSNTFTFQAGGPATTRGMPFETRSTAFNGGRTLKGPIT